MTRTDLLILGGGIYGAAAAFEAARRGFSAQLVERDDFGAGTSSNSMKIAHGGLRYLQNLDFARSLESIRERRRLLALAPDIVRPLRCRMDLSSRSPAFAWKLRAGLWLNDIISWRRNVGVPKEVRLPRVPFPCWMDAIIEDTERLLMAYLQTAVDLGNGAIGVHNHVGEPELLYDGPRLIGVRLPSGERIEASMVLRCTGTSGLKQPAVLSMNAVVDPLSFAPKDEALSVFHPEDGRNVFLVPWRGRHIVGTWDRRWEGGPLRVDPELLDEFLAWLAPVHPELARLERGRVHFLHAGLVPAEPDGITPAHHFRFLAEPDGSMRVVGVKWTTARGVASEAVDRATQGMLHGQAVSEDWLEPLIDPQHMVEAYLTSWPALDRPLIPGSSLRVGEVTHAVEQAWAKTLSDVLLRRTALATAGHPGKALVAAVAREMAESLGWDEAEIQRQIEAFESDFRFAGAQTPV